MKLVRNRLDDFCGVESTSSQRGRERERESCYFFHIGLQSALSSNINRHRSLCSRNQVQIPVPELYLYFIKCLSPISCSFHSHSYTAHYVLETKYRFPSQNSICILLNASHQSRVPSIPTLTLKGPREIIESSISRSTQRSPRAGVHIRNCHS